MQNRSLIRNLWNGISHSFKSVLHNPYRQVNINWLKLKYYKHLPAGKIRKHRLLGKFVYFSNANELLHGLHEIFIEGIYDQQLPDQPYIIDCGANIGLSAIYMKEKHPSANILAFEPDENNFDLLSRNISSFGFAGIQLRKEAVWTENTTLNFSNEASMSSRIADDQPSGGSKVTAIRLKDYLDRKVDFLKMDIEGAEFHVLCDIQDQLKLVDRLFIEYHGRFDQNGELTRLFEIITQSGFSYYIKEATPVYPRPFQWKTRSAHPWDVQLNIFCFRN